MKKVFIVAFLLAIVASSQAQTGNPPSLSDQVKCCPDTGSLISDDAGVLSADLAVKNVTLEKNPVSGEYTLTALVTNNGDDCSRCSKIVVMLPPEIKVLSYKAINNTTKKKIPVSRCLGMLVIDAGMMCPQEDYMGDPKKYLKTVKIVVRTSDHTDKISKASFAVMVYNKIPDLDLSNNYKPVER